MYMYMLYIIVNVPKHTSTHMIVNGYVVYIRHSKTIATTYLTNITYYILHIT